MQKKEARGKSRAFLFYRYTSHIRDQIIVLFVAQMTSMSAFGGKADIAIALRNVR
jgi:hypothetical protein